MRVGLVCPYSLDVPGRGAEPRPRPGRGPHRAWGIRSPSWRPRTTTRPFRRTSCRPGERCRSRTTARWRDWRSGHCRPPGSRRWIREGGFDVLHIHEPATPSLSLLALWAATGPIVGTFHTAMPRSRVMIAASSILRPALEKISARIAVSEPARATLVQHLGGEPVVIPNGLFVDRFAVARPRPQWRTGDGTVSFLGRLDEPRKGLAVLLQAFPTIWRARPGVRLLVAGRGDIDGGAGSAAGGVPVRGDLPRRDRRPDEGRDVRELGRVRRTADRWRVVRHRAGRGDGRRRAGARERPRRVPPGRGRRAGWGGCSTVGDAEALARSVLGLLQDGAERERLAGGGAARGPPLRLGQRRQGDPVRLRDGGLRARRRGRGRDVRRGRVVAGADGELDGAP